MQTWWAGRSAWRAVARRRARRPQRAAPDDCCESEPRMPGGDGMMRLKLVLTAIALCLPGHAAIAEELAGTLEKIRSTGTITIGHRESSIPFSYYDKNDKVVGYGMDLCSVVADAVKARLGLAKLEIKLVPITPSLRIPSILSGKIDLACETMTNNLERQKVVAFSYTYF